MPLVPMHEILEDAQARGYGVPCLIASPVEMLVAQVSAAEEMRSPLILAHNAAVTPDIPMDIAFPAMITAATHASVPIATILDHGDSVANCVAVIELGSSSVMFDGSALPYDENIALTAEVVREAKSHGVSVEGELGAVGGSSIEIGSSAYSSTKTDPDLAQDYVHRTGVNVLAISFGNSHGVYRGSPQLDLDLVRTIADLVDQPLAMHGASGLSEESYAPIIQSGISKINFYTAMARQVSHEMQSWFASAQEDDLVYHHVSKLIIERFHEHTKHLLQVLQCAGKA